MSTQSTQADGSTWKVIGQPQATASQDAMGAAVRGYMVTYQLGTGQQGQVFIPGASFDPDSAKPLIAAAAANLAGVLNLSSGS
jgi:hypothetical protein